MLISLDHGVYFSFFAFFSLFALFSFSFVCCCCSSSPSLNIFLFFFSSLGVNIYYYYYSGNCTTSLDLGCDCLGEIFYFDAVLNDTKGDPVEIKKAICMHEEDAGLLWKHVEYRNMHSEVRRSRRLVLSFLATVVTPDFPDGLTITEARGQWRDPGSGRIIAERKAKSP